MKFAPTWLYVKQHRVTGLKYFGKTIRDPFKYNGSGRYWKQHIKIHGKDIDTIWCELFDNEQHLVEFAEFFSKHYNIVNATDSFGKKIWANEIPENGIQGGQNAGFPSPLKGKSTGRPAWSKGIKRPDHSKKLSGRKHSTEHKKRISESLKTHKRTLKHSAAISNAKKGKPNPKVSEAMRSRPDIICPNCGLVGKSVGNMNRYHFNNCKLKRNNYVESI